MRAKKKPHFEQPLSLPPAPVDLGKSEADLAAATGVLKTAERSLHSTRGKTNLSGQPIATPEEIAAAQRVVDEARAASEAVRARRDRLRREYEIQCRETLGPTISALNGEVRGAVDLLANKLAEADRLQSRARATGINLGAPILSAADRLRGITKLLNGALDMLERRQ